MTSQMCSTPFGIRDSTRIRQRSQNYLVQFVLNAFRHQRFDTDKADKLLFDCFDCAQRLSASEIRHDELITVPCSPSCAQRLSASEIRHG